jgi:hypothetical protein
MALAELLSAIELTESEVRLIETAPVKVFSPESIHEPVSPFVTDKTPPPLLFVITLWISLFVAEPFSVSVLFELPALMNVPVKISAPEPLASMIAPPVELEARLSVRLVEAATPV